MTEDQCRTEFGKRLIRRMYDKRMSQKELSSETGISEQMLSRYINGKSTPSFYIVDKIAKVLNCSTDEFRYFQ
jgi:transcriptional regulator with XRE-family HTH domain